MQRTKRADLDILHEYRDDPVRFAEDVLGMRLWSKQRDILNALVHGDHVAVRSAQKTGKALHDDTPIPTPDGWRRYGDLKVGDALFSDTGAVCQVTAIVEWKARPFMRVHFEDGTHVDADERHEWVVRNRNDRQGRGCGPATVETLELMERLTVPNGKDRFGQPSRTLNFTVDLPGAVDMPARDLPLDPYVLGVWLGDGGTNSATYFKPDQFVADEIRRLGYEVSNHADGMGHGLIGLMPLLRSMNLLGNKHVPREYLWASPGQRLALLQGLMDTDGYCDEKGRVQFCTTTEQLAQSVLFLARSLGIKTRIFEKRATLYGLDCGPKWHVEWQSPAPVFRLPRKKARLRTEWKVKANAHRRMAIVNVERLPAPVDCRCIEVDSPSHLYLCGESFIPTHNSEAFGVAGLWWTKTREDGRVIMTASVAYQIRQIVWRTIKRLHGRAAQRGRPIGGIMHQTPQSGLQFPDGRQVIGFTAGDAEAGGGWSGVNLLFLVDEASGVDDGLIEAFEGNLAGGGKIAMVANPIRTSGAFFRAFHGTEARVWTKIAISAEESPNVTGKEPEVKGLATQQWIDTYRKRCGTNYAKHPAYMARVLGQFPVQSAFSIVSLDVIDTAKKRWSEDTSEPSGVLDVGVDVARYGDDSSVITAIRGHRMIGKAKLSSFDGPQVAALVREMLFGSPKKGDKGLVRRGANGAPVERPRVKVDIIGYGASAHDALKGSTDIELFGVNVAEKATAKPSPGKPEFSQLRDQLWFAIADWLHDGGTLPGEDDPDLEADLLGAEYGYNTAGKIKVASKDEMKEVLGHSPDDADSLALAIYTPPKPPKATQGTIRLKRW